MRTDWDTGRITDGCDPLGSINPPHYTERASADAEWGMTNTNCNVIVGQGM